MPSESVVYRRPPAPLYGRHLYGTWSHSYGSTYCAAPPGSLAEFGWELRVLRMEARLPRSDVAPQGRKGCSMTESQLLRSVVDRKRVTFEVFDGPPITGFLAGLDSERFFVLATSPVGLRKLYISRTDGAPVFEIHDVEASSRYEQNAFFEEMERIIRPFRTWISKNVHRKPTRVDDVHQERATAS